MSMLFKRIKDWATTITAFRTGDVIPVDGPSGTAKMAKDDLLAITRKNLVIAEINDVNESVNSSNIAPYVPNGKSCFSSVDGKLVEKDANGVVTITTLPDGFKFYSGGLVFVVKSGKAVPLNAFIGKQNETYAFSTLVKNTVKHLCGFVKSGTKVSISATITNDSVYAVQILDSNGTALVTKYASFTSEFTLSSDTDFLVLRFISTNVPTTLSVSYSLNVGAEIDEAIVEVNKIVSVEDYQKVVSVSSYDDGYWNGTSTGGAGSYKHTKKIRPFAGMVIKNGIHNTGLAMIQVVNYKGEKKTGLNNGASASITTEDYIITQSDIETLQRHECPFVVVNLANSGLILGKPEDIARSTENDLLQCESKLLTLADVYPIVYGNRLELFVRSMTDGVSDDVLDVRCVNTNNKTYAGLFRSNAYYFDSASDKSEAQNDFILSAHSRKPIAYASTSILPIAKKSSPLSQKNVLCIGDSYTYMQTYITELKRRLTGSGGLPIADGLNNINFIGTIGGSQTPCEGYSGKTFQFFTSDQSPFWYNGAVDFTEYCTDHGYSGIDIAVVLLGANGYTYSNSADELLDKLVEYNPSIKILFGCNACRYNMDGWETKEGLSAGVHATQFPRYIAKYNAWAKASASRHPTNILFVDIPNQLDSVNNFRFEMVAANNRNDSVMVRRGNDNVHPASSGFLQIADAMYNAFHYWCLE